MPENVCDIPGVRESGWDEKSVVETKLDQHTLFNQLSGLLTALYGHPDSWPFHEPVDTTAIKDYLTIIKTPMGIDWVIQTDGNRFIDHAKAPKFTYILQRSSNVYQRFYVDY